MMLSLNVLDAPILLEHNNPGTVQEGGNVALSVTIRSNPKSVVNWVFPSGKLIEPNVDKRYDTSITIIEPDGYEDPVRGTTVVSKLVITNVSNDIDSGTFQCFYGYAGATELITFPVDVGSKFYCFCYD